MRDSKQKAADRRRARDWDAEKDCYESSRERALRQLARQAEFKRSGTLGPVTVERLEERLRLRRLRK